MYNRFGEDSPMLEAMSSEEILGTALDDLLDAPGELLNYEHTLAYTGSMPLEELVETLRRIYEVTMIFGTHLSTGFEAREIDTSEVLVVDQQTAQAQVRIEFADGVYDSEDGLLANLYTSYFGSGMSSVVFQELREARALAYLGFGTLLGWQPDQCRKSDDGLNRHTNRQDGRCTRRLYRSDRQHAQFFRTI